MRVFLLAAFLAAPVQAQPEASFDYQLHDYAGFRAPQANTFETGAQVRLQRFAGRGRMPWKAGEKTTLAAGLSYELDAFTYNKWDFVQEPSRVERLHRLAAGFELKREFAAKTDGWSASLLLEPALQSDFMAVTSKSLALRLRALLERDAEADFGFGLAFTDAFGSRMVLPAFRYRRSWNSLLLSLDLPTDAEFLMDFGRGLTGGFALRTRGGDYRLERQGAWRGHRLRHSTTTIGPAWSWRHSSGLGWRLDGGWTLRHRFESDAGRQIARDMDLERKAFLSTGLSWAFGL